MATTPFRTPNNDLIITSGTVVRGEDSSPGSNVLVRGGDTTSGGVAGGTLTLNGGDGNGMGAGGALSVVAGSGGATGVGGAITITGGAGGSTSGDGGNVEIDGGTVTSGIIGDVRLAMNQAKTLALGFDFNTVSYGTDEAFVGARTGVAITTEGDAAGSPIIIQSNLTNGANGSNILITAGDGVNSGAFSTGNNVVITAGDGLAGAMASTAGTVTITAGEAASAGEAATAYALTINGGNVGWDNRAAIINMVNNQGGSAQPVQLRVGTIDPSDLGQTSALGSLFFRDNASTTGELYLKTGTGLNDWNLVMTTDTTAASLSLDATTSSNFTVTANTATPENLTFSATNSGAGTGNVLLNADDEIDATATTVDVNATGSVALDAQEGSNFTVTANAASAENLTFSATNADVGGTAGILLSADDEIDITADAVDVNATSAVTIDSAAASNFTVAGDNLTLSTTTSGNVAVTAADAVTVTAGNEGAATGNAITLTSGDGGGANDGGAITLASGDGGATDGSAGGAINITAGVSSATNGDGGDIVLTSGLKSGTGSDGSVVIATDVLRGGDASRQFQILSGTEPSTSGELITGPSILIRAQGDADQNGGEIVVGSSVIGNPFVEISGGNAVGSNAVGGPTVLYGGAGNGTGNGGAVTLESGDSGSGATGNGGAINLTAGDALSTNGDGGNIVLTGGAGTGTGAAGAIAMTTEGTAGPVSLRTTSGFTSTQIEHRTFGSQENVGASGTNTIVVLGTLDTNGRNLKVDVYATAQDNATDANISSYHHVQTFYRSGGIINGLTAHVSNSQSNGWNMTFSILVNGNDLELQITEGAATAEVANVAVHWTIQEGGFAS